MSTFTDAQREAILAEGNVLVSAGAGTGKTRTVVERCLRLIREGCSLENILMVTFTEAAAAEMRARLRSALEHWRDELHESPLEQSRSPADRSSTTTIEEQLALLNTAHISTMHAFCLELVRDHFHELDIDPQVTVLDQAQSVPLIHETLDALLERCYSGVSELSEPVKNLVRQHGGSDEKIRSLVLKLHRYTQSLPRSGQWVERELAQLEPADPTHWRAWLVKGVAEWRDEWLPDVTALADSPQVACCVAAIRQLTPESSLDAIAETMRCIVATEEGKWSRSHPKKYFHDPIEGFFKDAKFLLPLTERCQNRDPLTEDWEWMREPTRTLLRLAQEFTAEFTRAKRSQGGVDFNDLEQLALQVLVDERGEPTENARAWQDRFTHVFVDECQDINAAQDAIIRGVSRGPAHGTGNRFLVGDVKQSIYRFRLADPGIFRRYEEEWRWGHGGQRIPLADNFRSRESLLNFINPFFAKLMRPSIGGIYYDADAQLRFGAPLKRAALTTAANPGPHVELHVICKTSADDASANGEEIDGEPAEYNEGGDGTPIENVLAIETEARLVANRLREVRESRHPIWDEDRKVMRNVDWRDMVVLLRSPNARVEMFAKEFSRAGVPLAAARAGFYSAIEVQDLVNLLRLLDNPLQDVPLAGVLHSPLVALSPNELAAVRVLGAGGNRHAAFVGTVNHFYYKHSDDALPEAQSARAKLRGFYESFERWRTLMRQTSVSHCLEKVLAETQYEALLLAQPRGPERLANVQRLLELARQYDPFQRQGLYRFLRFIEQQQDAELDEEAAVVAVTNAVRLMSIHKSKGLEFPVVVVACLAGQFNMQDLREDVLLSSEFGVCPRIVPPHAGTRYPSLPWWLAKRREKRELLGEEMRLLYVAMTRARDTLVLTAFDKSKDAGARWHLGAAELDDRAILKSRSCFAWLSRWLGATTSDAEWSSEREGATEWLRWTLHAENHVKKLATRGTVAPHDNPGVEFPCKKLETDRGPATSTAAAEVESLRTLLMWKYPFTAATEEPAKTNVTVLRRRATEQDDEAHQWFVQRRRVRSDGTLTAAEIGLAHHSFLQHVRFDHTGSAMGLRKEAERLLTEGVLSSVEAAALDYDALLAFWLSMPGRRVVTYREIAQRELPFTVRLTMSDLRLLGLSNTDADASEFVVVQGIVDVALIGRDWIEILDFKTDQLGGSSAREKAVTYAPQIRLYAEALRAIYRRPVRSAALHFLATGETLPISIAENLSDFQERGV